MLKKVANHDTTVLCTIHQPSSEVFFLFDLVIVMKNGQVLFHGPVSDIISYLSKFGFDCPQNFNPSDYVMYVAQTETSESIESKGLYMVPQSDCKMNSDVKTEFSIMSGKSIEVPHVSFWTQMKWLVHREFLDTFRDRNALRTRFGSTVFLSFLISLIFLGAGGKNNAVPDNFNAHFGALTLSAMLCMIGAAQPMMLHIPLERPLFLREYSTGTCKFLLY